MRTLNDTKKASLEDWHPADIVASLRKAGWSLRGLSVHHKLSPGTLKAALQVPYPNGERLIAEAIGIKPWEIWPSRYDSHGHPNRGRKLRGFRSPKAPRNGDTSNVHVDRQFNAQNESCNVKVNGGA